MFGIEILEDKSEIGQRLKEIRLTIERESNINRFDEDVDGNAVALGRAHTC
jgi:hypothetical protein